MKEILTFFAIMYRDHYVELISIGVIVVIIFISINRVHRYCRTKYEDDFFKSVVLCSAFTPLKIFVIFIGIYLIASISISVINSLTMERSLYFFANEIRNIGIVILMLWMIIVMMRNFAQFLIGKDDSRFDATTVNTISKLCQVFVGVLIVIPMLQHFGISLSGLLAFGGLGGVIVGFAAKDLLSNFFGALIIALDRPFAVGDTIRSPDRKLDGSVIEVGWRLTQIMTFNNHPVYVPNYLFGTIIVENLSRCKRRRIYEILKASYNIIDDINNIVDDINNIIISDERFDQNLMVLVAVKKIGTTMFDFLVQVSTMTNNYKEYHMIFQGLMIDIARICKQYNCVLIHQDAQSRLYDKLASSAPDLISDNKENA